LAKEQLKTIEEPVSKQSNAKHINGNGEVKKTGNESLLLNKKNGKKTERALKNTSDKIDGTATFEKDKSVTEKKSAPKKSSKLVAKKSAHVKTTRLIFQLRFSTKPGENLYITADHSAFGNGEIKDALQLQYLNDEMWVASIDLDILSVPAKGIIYNYLLKYADGQIIYDWGSDKKIDKSIIKYEEVLINDAWNHAGYFQNAFYTEPFQNVLLKNNFTEVKLKQQKNFTHIFKIKSPLLAKGETVCMLGSADEVANWNEKKPILLSRKKNEDFFSVALNLSQIDLPLYYKYGIYNTVKKQFVKFEDGANRVLYHAHAAAKNKITIANDGFINLPADSWKGAGVTIPVFSLRSKNSWGVGEFTDIKLLVDWAKKTGLQLIQILPVNDTSATHTWVDSYPYAAISAFALHPMYLNPEQLANEETKYLLEDAQKEKEQLNKKTDVDYEAVNKLKWSLFEKIYAAQKKETFSSDEYKTFFHNNKHWLVPYAAFCFFRDEYQTADFNNWSLNKQYAEEDVVALLKDKSKADKVAVHFFIQFHLHLQLQQAAQYAHDNGIIIKGDIPIGVYRYGADAWQQPDLYHINMQSGAPPDDFAVKGQNWGFPTYNWKKMEDDDFAWWKKRFEQMSNYFDAFRIDHILGFFRIWSIPMHSVEGIMGHFEPCIPVHINEFRERNTWFDFDRYTKPFITDQVLYDLVGSAADYFKQNYLQDIGYGKYSLREEFSTQIKVEDYFIAMDAKDDWKKQKLFDLISNIILFEAEDSNGQQFHFRFAVESTKSFQYLDYNTQQQLKDLYVDYFFRRQDDFWKKEAMQKLPALKRATNMLVCGEDLGLVPGSVPAVMNQLGLLSLEIQRMPKQTNSEFFHPNDAPYLSVVTPSTHDMSTIRGWWEEDRNKTQRFYNYEMGKWGDAPFFCEAWVNKAILNMHYYSPAMWSVFLLQDLLGTSKELRRENPHEERINVPAITNYYWRYRMHLYLEDLLEADDFNTDLWNDINACGRAPKD
jgi:4-alpha-glucanotransferase